MRPIDADALKKQIEDFHCKDCDNYNFVRCRACHIDDAISYLDEAPTIGGWISVKDRLPERKWIDYLVATRILNDGTIGCNIAWLNSDDGVWGSNDKWICDGREIVTHWMPLPEPPKEVKQND